MERVAYSVNEAAEAAGLSRSLLYQEMSAGRLRYVKIRSRRLIMKEDLNVWLLAHRSSVKDGDLLNV